MFKYSKTTPFAVVGVAMFCIVAGLTFFPVVAGQAHFAWLAAHAVALCVTGGACAVAALCAALFCENFTGRFSPVALIAGGATFACLLYCFVGGGEVITAIGQVEQAKMVASEAAANIGAKPGQSDVEKRLAIDASSWAAYTRDRAFIENVANATTLRGKILEWLAAAREFGLDGKDVAASGMVTPEDNGRLFQRAMQVSATGDGAAIAWVAGHSAGG